MLVRYSSSAPQEPVQFYKSVSSNEVSHVERINFMVQLLPLTCLQIYEEHETWFGRGPRGLKAWAHSEMIMGFQNCAYSAETGP